MEGRARKGEVGVKEGEVLDAGRGWAGREGMSRREWKGQEGRR